MRWPRPGDKSFRNTGIPNQAASAAAGAPVSAAWWVATFILVSAGLLAAALLYLRAEAVRSGERLTQSLAQVIGEQTSRSFQAVDERLQLAASRLQAMQAQGTLDESSARTMLRGQLAGLQLVRAIWVLDREGRIIFDSDVGNIGVSLADRAYFQRYKQRPDTGFFIGQVVRSRSTGDWLLSASRPLHDATGQFAGIIVAAVEPPYFEKTWRGIDLGRGGAIALFSRDGRLMMRTPADNDAMGKDFSHLDLFSRHLKSSPQGVFITTSPLDGLERVLAWRVLSPYSDLLVVVGSSYDEILAPWRRFATLTIATWLAAAMIAIGLAWQVYRQASRRQRGEIRFRQLAQAMPQIVFIANSRGEVQFINDRWTESTGRPVGKALGFGWVDAVHPEDREPSLRLMTGMLHTGKAVEHEHRLLYRDGRFRWQLLRAVPITDDEGRVDSWYGTSTEIDDLKKAQEQLRAQADLLSTASRLSRMGGWVVSIADRRIAWSDEASAILDMPAGSSPSLDQVFQLFSPRARETTIRAVQECIDNGTPFDLEVEMKTATGRPVWVRSIGRAVRDAEGRIVRIEGAQQDITQRVSLMEDIQILNFGLEEKIAQRTRELMANEAALRLANLALESFSYSVSHDLQSPLQRVASFAQLLGEEIGASPSAKAHHYLSRIRANTDHMTQLIDGLLALAQVSQMEMIRGEVNLSDIARDILERMQSEHPARRVAWQVEPGLAVSGDARLMRCVMENLLGNAWKFTSRKDGAEVTFGRGPAAGEYFVRDNGAGFDMAYAGKLFGTFQRLHREDEFEGTGIGLATVARAINRQGGRIWAKAEPGRGATFYFTLPGVMASSQPTEIHS